MPPGPQRRLPMHPRLARSGGPDLLRLVAPDWVDELDLAASEDCSSEHREAAAHRKRLGDMAWRVRFRKGRLTVAPRLWCLGRDSNSHMVAHTRF